MLAPAIAHAGSFLPAPRNKLPDPEREQEQRFMREAVIPRRGERQGFVPRAPEDFGDGGAFPEIHVAQYPLNMGRKSMSSVSGRSKALEVDEHGRIKWDALMNYEQGQIVHSTALSLVEKQFKAQVLERPDEEEVQKTTERTRQALEQIVDGKIRAARPSSTVSAVVRQGSEPTYIRYTPSQSGGGHAGGSQQRIVRMVEAQVDPLEPAKFKHKRAPGGPPSPPVPVMHSPPKKITHEDQEAWKIPPCISNWKNNKGYTIPLDKRLASSGAGLQEAQINDNFARFSQSLYIAERTSREEIARRNAIAKKVIEKEREEKERQLQDMAARSRMRVHEPVAAAPLVDEYEEEEEAAAAAARQVGTQRQERDVPASAEQMERDRIRDERRRERERQLRKEFSSFGGAKSKQLRDDDRDISEKIALGQVPAAASTEVLYDQRLFNQSSGLDSGFGSEDSNKLYDKPLFRTQNQLYQPRRAENTGINAADMAKINDTSRFRPDKGFQGAEGGKPTRSGDPVEFEYDQRRSASTAAPAEDPFGFNSFLSSAGSGGAKKPLDRIGTSGAMHAAAAGSGLHPEREKRRRQNE
jgi:SNW domain-containing protein 1